MAPLLWLAGTAIAGWAGWNYLFSEWDLPEKKNLNTSKQVNTPPPATPSSIYKQ